MVLKSALLTDVELGKNIYKCDHKNPGPGYFVQSYPINTTSERKYDLKPSNILWLSFEAIGLSHAFGL